MWSIPYVQINHIAQRGVDETPERPPMGVEVLTIIVAYSLLGVNNQFMHVSPESSEITSRYIPGYSGNFHTGSV